MVYVWMLAGLYPERQLEAAAVTSRLVTVLAELTVLLVVWWSGRSRGDRGAAPHDEPETSSAVDGPRLPSSTSLSKG